MSKCCSSPLTSIVTAHVPDAATPPPANVSVSKVPFTVAVPPHVFDVTAAAYVSAQDARGNPLALVAAKAEGSAPTSAK